MNTTTTFVLFSLVTVAIAVITGVTASTENNCLDETTTVEDFDLTSYTSKPWGGMFNNKQKIRIYHI